VAIACTSCEIWLSILRPPAVISWSWLELVGTARKPPIHGYTGVRSQEVDLEVIAGLNEPQVFVGDAAGEAEMLHAYPIDHDAEPWELGAAIAAHAAGMACSRICQL
jgi:hypothetical protein